jgi:hypothetical protein
MRSITWKNTGEAVLLLNYLLRGPNWGKELYRNKVRKQDLNFLFLFWSEISSVLGS